MVATVVLFDFRKKWLMKVVIRVVSSKEDFGRLSVHNVEVSGDEVSEN